MKKIIVAADSFKGSMSSETVCNVVKFAIEKAIPGANVITIPIADGGEGTIDVLGAEKRYVTVNDAFFQPVLSYWGKLGEYAVIELAAVAGLPMAKQPNPMVASTYGVGQLILDALNQGERKFILALGGSSTNDLGCGFAAALGAKFYNKAGETFVPTGGTLICVERVDLTEMDRRLEECSFVTMCDVTNPLCGENGAAYVFAPQKGATDEMLPLLDEGLKHTAEVLESVLGKRFRDVPGAGAAGGCGAGSAVFLNSKLQSGIQTVLDLKAFDENITGCDLVISGEGRFDSQSAGGKAVCGIASRCKQFGVPLFVLCGSYQLSDDDLPDGISAVFSILNKPCSLSDALASGKENLYQAALQIGRMLKSVCK